MRVIRWLKFVLAAIGLFTVLKHGVILLIGMIDDPDDLYTQVYPHRVDVTAPPLFLAREAGR